MTPLHSQIIGSGSPLVILHGFLGMGDNWKTLALKFADQGYQVHLVDQRNHGRSFHDAQFTYNLLSEDLCHYCIHHKLQRVVLIGHSMGGKTAMTFATQNPHLCAKLVVADIGPKAYPQHHQFILKGLSELDNTQLTSRKQAEEILTTYVPEPGVRQFLLKNLYWVASGQLGLRVNVPALSTHAEQIGQALKEEARFDGPTLFLKGAHSGYIEATDLWLMQHHFPMATLQQIERAGHWLHAENPEDFLAAVSAFLAA